MTKLRKGNLFVIFIGLQTTATTTATKFITLTIPPSILGSLQCRHHFNHHIYYFSSIDTRGGSRGRVQGVRILPPPPPEMTYGFLIQLVFCKKTMWFIGVEVEQETSAPPPPPSHPKKNPGSAPGHHHISIEFFVYHHHHHVYNAFPPLLLSPLHIYKPLQASTISQFFLARVLKTQRGFLYF